MKVKHPTVTADAHLEEVEFDGNLYDIELTVSGEIVNVGIGPYEFWGAKYNDVRMGFDGFTIKRFDLFKWDAENEKYVLVQDTELTDKLIDHIYDTDALNDKVLDALHEAMEEREEE